MFTYLEGIAGGTELEDSVKQYKQAVKSQVIHRVSPHAFVYRISCHFSTSPETETQNVINNFLCIIVVLSSYEVSFLYHETCGTR